MGLRGVGYRLAAWGSRRLPAPAAFWLIERLADVRWRTSRADRQGVCANVSRVLGRPIEEGSPLVRDTFRNFGRYLVELFTFDVVAPPTLRLEGLEHLSGTLERVPGAIAMTAHLGNWELAARVLRRMNIPVTVIALPHEDPWMNAQLNWHRQQGGLNVLPLGAAAARQGLKHLRQGGVLGVLGDRDFSGHGVTVAWGDGEAMLPSGPAILSLRSGAPVIPMVLAREGRWVFRLCVEPPIWPDTGGTNGAAIQRLTQRYAQALERFITRFPEQWIMFQPLVPAVKSGP